MVQARTANNPQHKPQALITFDRQGHPIAFRILADSAGSETLVRQSLRKMLRPYMEHLPQWMREVLL